MINSSKLFFLALAIIGVNTVTALKCYKGSSKSGFQIEECPEESDQCLKEFHSMLLSPTVKRCGICTIFDQADYDCQSCNDTNLCNIEGLEGGMKCVTGESEVEYKEVQCLKGDKCLTATMGEGTERPNSTIVKECSESCDQFEYHGFLLSQDHANPSKVEKCEICDDRDLCNGMQTATTTLAVFVNPTEEPCNTEHLANYKNKNSECFAKISQSIQNCTLGQGGGSFTACYSSKFTKESLAQYKVGRRYMLTMKNEICHYCVYVGFCAKGTLWHGIEITWDSLGTVMLRSSLHDGVINITNNVISKDRKIDEYIKSLLSGELCDNQTDSGNEDDWLSSGGFLEEVKDRINLICLDLKISRALETDKNNSLLHWTSKKSSAFKNIEMKDYMEECERNAKDEYEKGNCQWEYLAKKGGGFGIDESKRPKFDKNTSQIWSPGISPLEPPTGTSNPKDELESGKMKYMGKVRVSQKTTTSPF